ncbi:hypothetical protein D9757_001171 [Collybiopsis confluens]|uniref:RRM domain-containing protein n=1 Tax=Collybiopsis confluens TaxID=2823264 RepID=A0A8H5I180_9AGAR|nr:hypothetical protein D9757_001171 [Collybiopsis confluens]
MSSSPEPSSDAESDSHSEPEQNVSAISHAAKRRQKKKEKLAAKQGAAPATKKRKLDDGTGAAVDPEISGKSRQNSVWVGNLSFKTTQQSLRTFFDGVGEITRIHMPMKVATRPNMPPESRGFAYVDFSTPDAKVVAITLSERPLLGRKLLIKDGADFTGRPTAVVDVTSNGKTHSKTALKILKGQKQPPAPTLFFGNLPFETTDDDIRGLLDAHKERKKTSLKRKADEGDDEEEGPFEEEKSSPYVGEADVEEKWIRRIRLGTFEDSGLCKGFGFVDFSSIDHATSALINPKNHHLNGRNLVVEYASSDAVKRGPNKPKAAAGDERAPGGDFMKKKGGHKASAGREPKSPGNHRKTQQQSQLHTHRNEEEPEHVQDDADTSTGQKYQPNTSPTGRAKTTGADERAYRHKGPRNRPKPGAALAQAKRQSAAIMDLSSAAKKKIVF